MISIYGRGSTFDLDESLHGTFVDMEYAEHVARCQFADDNWDEELRNKVGMLTMYGDFNEEGDLDLFEVYVRKMERRNAPMLVIPAGGY